MKTEYFVIFDDDELMHYGMPRRSGRYPWGSGENPYQHSGDFLARVEELRKSNPSYTDPDTGKVYTGDTAVAKIMGLTTSQFRVQYSLATDERRAIDVATAKALREKGYSLNEIADKMGFKNDSSVRSLLNESSEARMNQAKKTAEFLKKQVDEKGMIDVGAGVERELGLSSREKLNEALYILELQGYNTFGGGVPQVTNSGRQTNLMVLCPPDTPYKINDAGQKVSSAIYDFDKIHSATDYVSHDGGETFDPKFVYPKSMDSKRLKIRYAEEGGIDKDGVIEIRRGVKDLSLGESHYAQVRILVDDEKYLKGMAVYSDNMPDGVDVIFNTNKKQGTPMGDVLKTIKKNDPDNPFGSLIKEGVNDPDRTDRQKGGQSYYYDDDGKKQLSLINKRSDEGDWGEWSNKLPSQFLSKQPVSLVNKQLGLAIADKESEYDEICSLTNPTVKKALLKSFSEDCDSAAVHLQAAALPRQSYQVIMPLTTIKDTEVFAPNYRDGERVALIRYPHGGTFEIPILTVNNKLPEARAMFGTNPKDVVGINKKVADRLSGADFDGDTVMVIPTGGKVKIVARPPLKGLEGFDPKLEYGYSEVKTDKNGVEHYYRDGREFALMKNTQTEMGIVSNLISDMTLKGATEDELARAVRHSMVVIDAEKHKLDYKQSYLDNNISALKKKYQGVTEDDGKYHEGAATIVSKAKSQQSVLKRRGTPYTNVKGTPGYDPSRPEGAQIHKTTYQEYTDPKTGKTKVRMQASTKMEETDDAFTLVSDMDNQIEKAYATYANRMKSLGNRARLEIVRTGKIPYSASSKKTYQNEVDTLKAKLNIALKNAPRERKAQLLANSMFKAKMQACPDMTKAEQKKVKQQALTQARQKVGAKRYTIPITDREWEAIQAGAITESMLQQILNHTDSDLIRQLATPRTRTDLSEAKISQISAMKASGYTNAEIAERLGISTSTVSKYL